jgi:hypothetical protein
VLRSHGPTVYTRKWGISSLLEVLSVCQGTTRRLSVFLFRTDVMQTAVYLARGKDRLSPY